MKKFLLFALIALSCSSAPKGFCECLEKGEQLNKLTNDVLRGDLSNAKKNAMLKARKEKDKLCVGFADTGGAEMREWKKDCAK